MPKTRSHREKHSAAQALEQRLSSVKGKGERRPGPYVGLGSTSVGLRSEEYPAGVGMQSG